MTNPTKDGGAKVEAPKDIAQLCLEIRNLAHRGWEDRPNAEFLFREIGKRAQKISEAAYAPALTPACGQYFRDQFDQLSRCTRTDKHTYHSGVPAAPTPAPSESADQWKVVRGTEGDDWGISRQKTPAPFMDIAQMVDEDDAVEIVRLHNEALASRSVPPSQNADSITYTQREDARTGELLTEGVPGTVEEERK